jgi:dTDP-D-glucose 4,6-dehydratase
MKTIKSIIKNIDLYGLNVLLCECKNSFTFVSFCEKSIPTNGSITVQIEKFVKFSEDSFFKKVTYHKNGNFTIQTNKAFFKFLN